MLYILHILILYKNIQIYQLEYMNQVIQNLKKREELSFFVESQKGDMDKFIKINKKCELENTGNCSLNKEECLLRDLVENLESTIECNMM